MFERRILIISHLAINNTNNVGKTLFSIFNKFKKNELIQLFFNPTLPNVDMCFSWFQVTDIDMLKSLYHKKAGREICFSQSYDNTKDNFYSRQRGRSTLRLLLRDILWLIGNINKKLFIDWLIKNNPTAIFLAPGYNCFPYRLARYISKKMSIPIMTFLMDDFYCEKKNNSYIESIRRKWLQYEIKKTVEVSKKVYACSKEMAQEYSKWFGKEIEVLYTPFIEDSYERNEIKEANTNTHLFNSFGLKFLYAGSLGLKRWDILLKIGNILKDYYPKSSLMIYANDDYKDEIRILTECKNIKYGGFITSDKLNKEIKKSHVVLHVESFDSNMFMRTRYSISTKIPECLASEKYFLAIGPKGQSGIEYLKRNEAAFVCDNENNIKSIIDKIHNNDEYQEIRERTKSLLKKNHNAELLHERLIKALL